MRIGQVVLLAVSSLLLFPVRAHHEAYACIARDQVVTVQGVIEDIRYEDPHVVFWIKTDQSVIVVAEWRSLWELSNRWGITREILRRGDRVSVRGSPYDCESNQLSLIVEVRRLADGWSWSTR